MPVLTTIIGGRHKIDETTWVLSWVRKEGAEHAFLILEGVNDDGSRFTQDAHLVVKKTNPKKADIVYRDISLEQLQQVGQSCHSYTWSLNLQQVKAFKALVQSEQQRAQEDKIDYVLFGKSKVNGLLGNISRASDIDSEEACTDSNSTCAASMDSLLRNGHNCVSWSKAMVEALQLTTPTNWVHLIIVAPNDLKGHQDGNNLEPTTTCRLL